jgi:hypothetical protein
MRAEKMRSDMAAKDRKHRKEAGEDIAEDDDADFFSLLRKTRGMSKDDEEWWQQTAA